MVAARCKRPRCERPAYFAPVIMFHLLNDDSGDVYECHMDLPMCRDHKKELKLETLLDPVSWEIICNGFLKNGKEVPNRQSCKFRLKRI